MPPIVIANVLQPLVDFFEGILKFFHDTVGFGWGLSIIVMTLVVRACLLPLTLKQFHGMQRLAKVPLMVSGDFERGASMRVDGTTVFPHAMAFGATGNPAFSRFEVTCAAQSAQRAAFPASTAGWSHDRHVDDLL